MNYKESYASNESWKGINQFLPEDFQLQDNNLPEETFWNWRGNNVHLDTYKNEQATKRIFLHHGVGTNGRQLNMIFGHKMAALGYEVIAVDNLGYGMTQVNQKGINYQDWVDLFVDLVNHVDNMSPKKNYLYGLSAGGMLTYHAAAKLKNVSGIIGMTFLDSRIKTVRHSVTKTFASNLVSDFLLNQLAKTPLKHLRIPIKQVSKMELLVNHPDALKVFLKDKRSAGSSMPLQFLNSYSHYQQALEPKDFKTPVLLTQPGLDHWTPLELSKLSLENLATELKIEILPGSGHYPMEKEGLEMLISSAHKFISETN